VCPGAVTGASCEDLRDAVTRLCSTELERLETNSGYQHVIREGLAFVRGIDSPVWEPFAAEVERVSSGEVLRRGPLIQIAFPLGT
jgi:hypothetical protein